MLMPYRWLKSVDLAMQSQNRHICLLVNNFSGHYIDYQPRNIHLEFFQPNLTSHVQPCDAGIIRTTKALYRKAFCLRAVELDEAGARKIYKIDLLEAMRMVTEAWDAVAPSTIANCWNHAKVQPDAIPCTTEVLNATSNASMDPTRDPRAWKVIHTFAMSEM
jgi:hypothetical protein